MCPFLYLQVKYKEVIGQGTPIPDLPEVKRVKQTQKHISSVMAPPDAGPFLVSPLPPPTPSDDPPCPATGSAVCKIKIRKFCLYINQGAEGTWLHV